MPRLKASGIAAGVRAAHHPRGTGFRSVNVALRKEFELFANIRPARSFVPGGRFSNVDIVLVRETRGPVRRSRAFHRDR
jgi:isocitrate/isopropylmalate dehydrogenase